MNLPALRDACAAAVSNPAFAPGNGVTHCNQAAQFIANAMGCTELDNKMADQQHAAMVANTSGRWTKVDGASATAFALLGGLGFASMSSAQLKEAHGHIAAIYPAPMQFSGSLNKNIPIVANVGVNESEEKESMAFPVAMGEPDYFIYH